MSDDIVTRLREAGECPTPLRAYLARAVVLQAADEIERLRVQLRLANIDNFDTTAEVETLKAELVRNADECRETLTELRQRVETLTAERDEIRLSYCSLMEAYRGGDGMVTANKLGWGYLFAEDSK